MSVAQLFGQFAEKVDLIDAVYFAGLVLLGIWALQTSWGRRALENCRPRRNNMPLYVPFAAFLLWIASTSLAAQVAHYFLADAPDWQQALYGNYVYMAAGAAVSAVILTVAWCCFARRLKGFGLDWRTVPKDAGMGFVRLLAIWPLITVMLLLTPLLGKLLRGSQFEMTQHSALEQLTDYPNLSLKISVFVLAAIVAPVLEELLFRGLIQTTVRSRIRSPWASITVTSLLFICIHPDISHWPTLFVLAMCLGYAYEKSGSLLQPIFIHALFNGVTVLSVLYALSKGQQ